MISLGRLLQVRGVWERKALGLFLGAFREEMEEVAQIGPRAIIEDRWRTALLAVWQGAGDEWSEDVAQMVEAPKGVRDASSTWRKIIEIITIKSTQIVDTTQEDVAIASALGNPLDAYDDVVGRASTMAMTESVQALGFSQQETVKLRVPQLLKVWQAIIDDRTRPTHLDANGQIRKLNDPFDVGGAALQWPADSGGPPGEVINCRCWEDYILPR